MAQRRKDRAQIDEASGKIDELFEDVKRRYGVVKYDSAETIRLWREAMYSSSYQKRQ